MFKVNKKVPTTVALYCNRLSVDWYRSWCNDPEPDSFEVDEWLYHDGYDINVHKDTAENVLYVTAYPTKPGPDGYLTTNYSEFYPIITIERGDDGIFTFSNLNHTIEETQ
jgi:hypothetical protein